MSIRVDAQFKLSSDDMETLIVLYQPLFSFPALSYYFTLYGLAQNDSLVLERDLIRRLHCKTETLDQWRHELEQLHLIRSFKGAHEELVLLKPLSPQDFLSHHILSRLFALVCSQETYNLMKERYRPSYIMDISKETTKAFDMRRLVSWSHEEEEAFNAKQIDKITSYQFDSIAFFKGFSIFPANLITEDVLKMVGEYGSFYQMSYVDMKSVMMDTIKYDRSVFDTYRFEKLMLEKYGKTSADSVKDPMELDPISYLVYRQGHDYVSQQERNAIMSIERDYGYSNEIANVIIDYIMSGESKQINKGYIDFLVQPMKRKGIETSKDAKSHLESSQKFASKTKGNPSNEVKMPDYGSIEIDEDQEELRALREQFEMNLKKGGN